MDGPDKGTTSNSLCTSVVGMLHVYAVLCDTNVNSEKRVHIPLMVVTLW